TPTHTLSLHDALPISTTTPLRLEIWRNARRILATTLYLSISEVENMYRWVNLRHVAGGTEARQTDSPAGGPPNSPDNESNGRQRSEEHTSELQSLAYL